MSGRTYFLLVVSVFVFSSVAWGALFAYLGVREIGSLATLAIMFGAFCMTGFLVVLGWYLKDDQHGEKQSPQAAIK